MNWKPRKRYGDYLIISAMAVLSVAANNTLAEILVILLYVNLAKAIAADGLIEAQYDRINTLEQVMERHT